MNLREEAKKYQDRLSKIKVCLFDVDGILTDGRIYYAGSEIGFNRFFHAHDGYGLRLLKQMDISVGIITAGNSIGVKMRAEDLDVPYLFMGTEDKRDAYLTIQEATDANDEEILYMGDELFDIPLLKKAGFSVTVPNASLEVLEAVDYVTKREAGHGAVREIVDMIRFSKNFFPKLKYF